MSRHMESHVYKCKDCDFKCNNARSLEVHKRAEHNFKCKKCKMTLATKEALATHTTLAHTFKCQKCGTLFEQKSLLEKHFRDSHMFKCPSCPQVEIFSIRLFFSSRIFINILLFFFRFLTALLRWQLMKKRSINPARFSLILILFYECCVFILLKKYCFCILTLSPPSCVFILR